MSPCRCLLSGESLSLKRFILSLCVCARLYMQVYKAPLAARRGRHVPRSQSCPTWVQGVQPVLTSAHLSSPSRSLLIYLFFYAHAHSWTLPRKFGRLTPRSGARQRVPYCRRDPAHPLTLCSRICAVLGSCAAFHNKTGQERTRYG